MLHAPQIAFRPITDVAEELGLSPDEWSSTDATRPKSISPRFATGAICRTEISSAVTSVTPTKAGEGKTTTAISFTETLAAIGERALACLREPSLGPVSGSREAAPAEGVPRSRRWSG